MAIKERLIKQRYGELNLRAPTKDDLDDYGLITTRLRKPVHDLFDTIIYQFLYPPKRDKYYKYYIPIVNQYLDELSRASKQSVYQSRTHLIDIHLVGKLIYMENHSAMFGGGYHNFKYTWIFNALSYMRAYIINRKYFRGEIKTNNTTAPWSAGFVPFPKSMGNNAMALLADTIYDIIQPRREIILAKNKAIFKNRDI